MTIRNYIDQKYKYLEPILEKLPILKRNAIRKCISLSFKYMITLILIVCFDIFMLYFLDFGLFWIILSFLLFGSIFCLVMAWYNDISSNKIINEYIRNLKIYKSSMKELKKFELEDDCSRFNL